MVGLRSGDAGQSAAVHVSDRRRRRLDGAGLASGRAATGAQGRSAPRHRRQQRRRQYFARARSGARRRDDLRLGIVAPFWINAISNLAIVGALLWWRPTRGPRTLLPAERFGQAILAGLRYARHNPHLRATLVRAAGFFLFASAYWALLPLVARKQIAGGPELYGVLLGVIGAGAVGGAFFLPWLKAETGAGPADGARRARPGRRHGAVRRRRAIR